MSFFGAIFNSRIPVNKKMLSCGEFRFPWVNASIISLLENPP